jgi:hypothetical protein
MIGEKPVDLLIKQYRINLDLRTGKNMHSQVYFFIKRCGEAFIQDDS